MTYLLTDDINLYHLVKLVFDKLLDCEVLFFSLKFINLREMRLDYVNVLFLLKIFLSNCCQQQFQCSIFNDDFPFP